MHGAAEPLRVEFEPRMCGQHVADLTVGCSFGCIYCPFSDLKARRAGVSRPTVVDVAALAALPAPPSVFLSSASDAFAPQAAPHTHALLERWLPRGTIVGIVTKGIVPPYTVDLLAEFREQVEGVSVGVVSLDEARNRVVEPGCPPAVDRLANIDRLAARGLPVALRMDPLFPIVDDRPAALRRLVAEGARRGARAIMAAYVFAWGRYLRRLRREPLLAEACRLLTERAPMEGGSAFSLPLTRKLETYGWLDELARSHGLDFTTCRCKDLRLMRSAWFSTSCRNVAFFTAAGLPAPSCGGTGDDVARQRGDLGRVAAASSVAFG
jgi:DNA repair photolyase